MANIDAPLHLVRRELEELVSYHVPPEPPPIKLDANESPWPLPTEAKETLSRALSELPLHRYPDGGAIKFRAALAARYGGVPEAYLVGSGSDEAIAMLATALSAPAPDRQSPVVLFPSPTFVMYSVTARVQGWKSVAVPLGINWQLDPQAMKDAFDVHAPNLAFYASPNNPTGNHFNSTDLRKLIETYPQTLHVIDEAYAEFSEMSRYSWCDEYKNVALLGTLSKIGLAAARVGWVRLDPELAQQVDKVRQPFNMNMLSQTVAECALGPLSTILREQVAKIVAERQRVFDALNAMPALKPYPSDANFVLVDLGDKSDAIQAALKESGVGVRFFAGVEALANHARLTIGTPEDNDFLLEALKNTP